MPRLLRRWSGSHKLGVIARAKVLRHGAGPPELDRMSLAGRPLRAGAERVWRAHVGPLPRVVNLKESYPPEVRDRLIWIGTRLPTHRQGRPGREARSTDRRPSSPPCRWAKPPARRARKTSTSSVSFSRSCRRLTATRAAHARCSLASARCLLFKSGSASSLLAPAPSALIKATMKE